MKKLLLVGLIASLVVGHIEISAQPTTPQKQSFWQRHKKKIIGGLVAAGALVTGAALAYHTDKTMTAIEKAGIQPSDPDFGEAVAYVGLVGPFGMKRALNLLKNGIAQGAIDPLDAGVLIGSRVGDALGYYWGVGPKGLKYAAAELGMKETGKAVKKAISQGIKNLFGG